MLSYLKTEKLADNTLTLTALCIASGIGIFATYNWGKATDRVGRRRIYLFGTTVMVIFAFPLFLLVNTGIAILIIIAIIIAYAVVQNSLAGAQGAWFPELFNANTRSSGASIAYQFSAVVSGFTPFIVTLLYAAFGWVGAASLFLVYGAIGLATTLITKETFGPDRTRRRQPERRKHARRRIVATKSSGTNHHSTRNTRGAADHRRPSGLAPIRPAERNTQRDNRIARAKPSPGATAGETGAIRAGGRSPGWPFARRSRSPVGFASRTAER